MKSKTKTKTKPSKRKFYKTVFTVTVLSEEPLPHTMELSQVEYAITDGPCSGSVEQGPEYILTPKLAARELEKQGSSPEFFGLNADGSESNGRIPV